MSPVLSNSPSNIWRSGRPASDNVTGAAVEVEHRRHARDELVGVKPMIASLNPEHRPASQRTDTALSRSQDPKPT